jgi:hypothetical protein
VLNRATSEGPWSDTFIANDYQSGGPKHETAPKALGFMSSYMDAAAAAGCEFIHGGVFQPCRDRYASQELVTASYSSTVR